MNTVHLEKIYVNVCVMVLEQNKDYGHVPNQRNILHARTNHNPLHTLEQHE